MQENDPPTIAWWLSGKESGSNAGDWGSIPGSERSAGEGNGNSLQYSCLENPMDRVAWRATVHRIAKSQIQLSDKHTHTQHCQKRDREPRDEKKTAKLF